MVRVSAWTHLTPSGADTAALPAAACRWTLPALRLSQQRPGGLRMLGTSEKRAYQRATRDYAAGGPFEGYARQGLQEERINPNYARQTPADAALWAGVLALSEARSERWAARRVEVLKESQSRAKTRRTRAARARRAAGRREHAAEAGKAGEALPRQVPARKAFRSPINDGFVDAFGSSVCFHWSHGTNRMQY